VFRFAAPIASLALLAALIAPASLLAADQPTTTATDAVVPDPGTAKAAPAAVTETPASSEKLSNSSPSSTAAASRRDNFVSIQDGNSKSSFRFAPSSLSVSAGTTVKWTNDGTQPHNVTGDGLKSKTLSHGDSYQFTFDDPGTYNYICTIHPYMKGSVKVSSSSSGGGSSGGGSSGGTAGTGASSAGSSTGSVPAGSTGTSSSVPTTGSSSSGSSSLPSTGLDAFLLAEIGVALLLGGLVLRASRRPSR
jgi:plastocyanin